MFARQASANREDLESARAALQAFKERHPETQELDIAERMLTPPKISASPAVQSEYLQLKLNAEYAQQLYDSSLKDLGTARVLTGLQQEQRIKGLHTVDAPSRPTTFSLRRMLLWVFMALLAALTVAVGAVFIAESRDQRIHSVADVEELLGLHVLAEVPHGPESARGA